MTDLTPQGAAAVRLAQQSVQLRRERDRAREWAVALEGRVAAVQRLHVPDDANQWCLHDGFSWPCATTQAARGATERPIDIRAALEADQ